MTQVDGLYPMPGSVVKTTVGMMPIAVCEKAVAKGEWLDFGLIRIVAGEDLKAGDMLSHLEPDFTSGSLP